jgi:hypothetical protein
VEQRFREAERDAVFGVARVAGSFASDLAEAREASRLLFEAIETHLAASEDPTGELRRALDGAAAALRRLRSPVSRHL